MFHRIGGARSGALSADILELSSILHVRFCLIRIISLAGSFAEDKDRNLVGRLRSIALKFHLTRRMLEEVSPVTSFLLLCCAHHDDGDSLG